ncbi:MAG TPA: DNA-3-methyladenine glycosylase [Burkholderiales bacterium]|nr:DNA-3-methyladenine glycosylase [Burkholderiales bacterium]
MPNLKIPSRRKERDYAFIIQGVNFGDDASVVARKILGMTLLIDGVGGTIVETEAYDEEEPASHAFRGHKPHNAALFGPPGHAYVYLSYGIHWCLNFVCREEGHGAGVLIRALEPTAGISQMIERRSQHVTRLLCSGPGRLGQALGVTRALDGKRIDAPPFELLPAKKSSRVVTGKRIGISKAIERRWRFGLAGSKFHSLPFR